MEAFTVIGSYASKSKSPSQPWKFIKKTKNIPIVKISSHEARRSTLLLATCALVGKFTSLYPSPKATEKWV